MDTVNDKLLTLSNVMKKRDKLIESVSGIPLESLNSRMLTDSWVHLLVDVPYSTLFKCLSTWDYLPRSKVNLVRYAYNIAGNTDLIKKDLIVQPEQHLNNSVSKPSQATIIGSRKFTDAKGESKCNLSFQIETGPYTPGIIDRAYKSDFLRTIAYHPEHGLGFKFDKGDVYINARQFYGMRCLITYKYYDGRITNFQVSSKQSHRKYNVELLDKRNRKGFSCPFHYDHKCHVCPRGKESCFVACHSRDWKLDLCEKCMSPKWIDPSINTRVCLTCTEIRSNDQSVH